ncbi:MAG TPA: BlaI/MecI/CopY family transcriptional regulator [Longimicrobiaceae bacterium]|nr:BlaI/MecI/CopY family transcriptional regulator [Longimicrobiaceae bacterium]
MPKRRPIRLTRAELQIMDLLWGMNEASIREIQERIPEGSRPAYTTVQTLMTRLEEKGAVRRTRKIGNAFLYEPLLTRKTTVQRVVDDVIDLLGGSATPLVSHMIESGQLTLDDLKALEREIGSGKEE